MERLRKDDLMNCCGGSRVLEAFKALNQIVFKLARSIIGRIFQ